MKFETLKDATQFEIEGIIPYLNEKEKRNFELVLPVYEKLNKIKEGKLPSTLYINLLDFESVKKILEGKVILNRFNSMVKLLKVEKTDYSSRETPYFIEKAYFMGSNKEFSLSFKTIAKDFKFGTLGERDRENFKRYFSYVEKNNAQFFIDYIMKPFQLIYQQQSYERNKLKANAGLKSLKTLNGERVSKSRIIKDPNSEHKYNYSLNEISNAFNTYLTREEKEKLINWLNEHVTVLNLSMLKGGDYDCIISKEFPDNIYGLKTRTIPSEEGTQDYCSGYVAVDNLDGCPLELFQRISRKTDSKDVFKKQLGKQYRFNSYPFVLFLLSNYNDIGYKTSNSAGLTRSNPLKNRLTV